MRTSPFARLRGAVAQLLVALLLGLLAWPAPALSGASTGTSIAVGWTVGLGGNPARDSRGLAFGPGAADVLWQGGPPALFGQQAVIEGNRLVLARVQNL